MLTEETVDKIIDVIYDHQRDLSDGFGYYDSAETWNEIRKEIKEILNVD